jgi:putative membrane protein
MKLKMGLIMAIAGLSASAHAQTAPDSASPPANDMQHKMHDAAKDHPLTDAQIVAIVTTTNNGEIAEARIEKNHGKNHDAVAFAKGMIEQHTQNNKDFTALEKKLQMHSEKTSMSDKIHKNAEMSEARLDKMKGADLDRAYIDKQVEMHQHVLDKLDNDLIPQAKNDDLKTLLQNTRVTVAEHLAHAEQVQKAVNGGTTISNQ